MEAWKRGTCYAPRCSVSLSGSHKLDARTLTRRGLPVALALVLLIGCALRWLERSVDVRWNSDEGISYLMSTCHGLEFADALGSGATDLDRFVPAKRWQRLIESDGRFCPGTVSHDLSEADVHPPLYFWLLHVWTLAFGRSTAAGTALNLLLFGVGFGLLFQLARRTLASRWDALGVCALFATSLPAVQSSFEFRPYGLLGTVTIGYALALSECCRGARPSKRAYAWLACALIAGLLSHYLFAFVVLASGILALLRLGRSHPRRLGVLAGVVVAAIAIACLIFPFHRQLGRRGEADAAVFGEHPDDGASIAAIERALEQPLLADRWQWGAAVLAGAVGLWVSSRRSLPRPRIVPWHRGWQMLPLCAAVAVACVLPRWLAWSPPHAVGAKYMAAAFGLLPFVLVFALRVLGRARGAALLALCVAYALPALANGYSHRDNLALQGRVLRDRRVVTHSLNRLFVPRLLAELRPDSELLVSDPDTLLALAPQLGASQGFAYAVCAGSPFQAQARRRLLAEFRSRYASAHKLTGIGKCWQVYHFAASDQATATATAARAGATTSVEP